MPHLANLVPKGGLVVLVGACWSTGVCTKEGPVKAILFIKCLHLLHAISKEVFSPPENHSALSCPPFALVREKVWILCSPFFFEMLEEWHDCLQNAVQQKSSKKWYAATYNAGKKFGPGIPGRCGHHEPGCQDVALTYVAYCLQISKHLSAITFPVVREGKIEAWMKGRAFLSPSLVLNFFLFCICCNNDLFWLSMWYFKSVSSARKMTKWWERASPLLCVRNLGWLLHGGHWSDLLGFCVHAL